MWASRATVRSWAWVIAVAGSSRQWKETCNSPPARCTLMLCSCPTALLPRKNAPAPRGPGRLGRLGLRHGRGVAGRLQVRDDPRQARHLARTSRSNAEAWRWASSRLSDSGTSRWSSSPAGRPPRRGGWRGRPGRGGRPARGPSSSGRGARASGSAWTTTSASGHDRADRLGRLVGDLVGLLETDRLADGKRHVGEDLRGRCAACGPW